MDTQTPDRDERAGIQVILNALPAMVGYWDRDLRNVLANDAYVSFFGRTPEALRGTHIRDLLGPDLYERNRPFIEGALAGTPQHFDREIRTPAGELRHTQASYIPDVADGLVRGFSVLVSDVTERRRAEAEIERSRAQLAEAEKIARLGSWEWDIEANRLTWSPGLFAIYGLDPEDFDGSYVPGSQRVHPEDRGRVDAEVKRAVEQCEPIDLEYRIVRPDGRVRRLRGRAEAITDADGRARLLVGTAQDVTEVRAAADVLHHTAADLVRRAADLHEPGRGTPARPAADDVERSLTPRQAEILALVSEGLSNAEIGERLFLAEATIKWHVRKILRALGVANRAQAVSRFVLSQHLPPG